MYLLQMHVYQNVMIANETTSVNRIGTHINKRIIECIRNKRGCVNTKVLHDKHQCGSKPTALAKQKSF